MAETERASQVAAGMSTAAAIAAALAWLSSRKAEAAPPGEITIPPELMKLLVAIAQSTDRIDEDILKILNAIATFVGNTFSRQLPRIKAIAGQHDGLSHFMCPNIEFEADIYAVNDRQLKQTACLCPTPPGAGETSGLVDEQPSLSKSCLERRRRFAILREALRSE